MGCLGGSVGRECVTLDLEFVSSNPTLDVEITQKKKKSR